MLFRSTTGGTNTVTGIYLNATETSLTGTTHNLMDLGTGGGSYVSKFKVDNAGNITMPLAKYIYFGNGSQSIGTDGSGNVILNPNNPKAYVSVAGYITAAAGTWTDTSSTYNIFSYSTGFTPSGAGSANFRPMVLSYSLNGSNGAQTGTATGILLSATETTLNGMTHNLMDLQVGGVSKFKITNSGSITTSAGTSGRSAMMVARDSTTLDAVYGVGEFAGNPYGSACFTVNANYSQWEMFASNVSVFKFKSETISSLALASVRTVGTFALIGSSTNDIQRWYKSDGTTLLGANDQNGILNAMGFKSTSQTPTVSGGAVTINCNLGESITINLVNSASTAITLTNAHTGTYTVYLKQDATGTCLATWATTVVWPGGIAPILTTTANYIDIIQLVYDGTTWRGFVVNNYAS